MDVPLKSQEFLVDLLSFSNFRPFFFHKLVPADGTNSTKVEGVGKLMKARSESYLECSATSPIRKLNNGPNNAILTKKTSSRLSYIAVGQSELSAVSESTNQKPGRSQGLEGGEYKRGGQC